MLLIVPGVVIIWVWARLITTIILPFSVILLPKLNIPKMRWIWVWARFWPFALNKFIVLFFPIASVDFASDGLLTTEFYGGR